jgi:hypothetical protein
VATRKQVYAVPFAKPVTVIGLVVELSLTLPGLHVAV